MSAINLQLPNADLRGLVTGETIIAFVPSGVVAPADHLVLTGSGPRPQSELKPAYQRWADVDTPAGNWTAAVETVAPAAALDRIDGASRHLLAAQGTGDLVVLRVSGVDGPVLTDTAFAARRSSLESAMRG